VIQHEELPEVINEVSVTLRLNILNHDTDWTCIFHKGIITTLVNMCLWQCSKVKLISVEVNCCLSILNDICTLRRIRFSSYTFSLADTSQNSTHARFLLNDDLNAGINVVGSGLLLNRWYHLAFTLSDFEKRLDFYIDGEWAGFQSIQSTQQIIFNIGPLYIGNDTFYRGVTGQIR
jgi:hypothetical protein